MNKLITQRLSALLLGLMLSAVATAAPPRNLPEGGRISESHILSMQVTGSSSASIVARPCDSPGACANILARVTAKTEIRDNGEHISLAQAKGLKWQLALMVTDKFNNVLLLNRIPESDD